MNLETPELILPMLAEAIPAAVWGGGPVVRPQETLFIWRTTATACMAGAGLAFSVWDERLAPLWAKPDHYTRLFRDVGRGALVEVDFSLWTDVPFEEQRFNVYRSRTLARRWQEAGMPVVPSMNRSTGHSFAFAFAGLPFHTPVVRVGCRTPGGSDTDRRAFLRGLHEGVRRIQPRHVIGYGGYEHRRWLEPQLPPGPSYRLLPSWQTARDAWRKREVNKHQLHLFEEVQWADVVQAVA
jgi:hypothetical protein